MTPNPARAAPRTCARLERTGVRRAQARARLAERPTDDRLRRRLDAAEADYLATLALYDATPGGQRELHAALDAAPDSQTREALTRRLEGARRLLGFGVALIAVGTAPPDLQVAPADSAISDRRSTTSTPSTPSSCSAKHPTRPRQRD